MHDSVYQCHATVLISGLSLMQFLEEEKFQKQRTSELSSLIPFSPNLCKILLPIVYPWCPVMYFNNHVKLSTRNWLNFRATGFRPSAYQAGFGAYWKFKGKTVSCFAVILFFAIILPGLCNHLAFIHDSHLVRHSVECLSLDVVAWKITKSKFLTSLVSPLMCEITLWIYVTC